MAQSIEERVSEARALLDAAWSQRGVLHHPGERSRFRERVEGVLDRTAALAREDLSGDARAEVWRIRLLAHAERAEDARHGAGQLSRSAQRAPTEEDCALGWKTVEGIVRNAEESAAEAAELSGRLAEVEVGRGERKRLDKAVRRAATAAALAREIVTDRNHAYVFHADPGFSFGEGWYVAAAAALCGVTVQIEPDKPQTAQAERFLRDAGLEDRLVPYRSRPRANKALPALIAGAFSSAPVEAQATVRAAFLGAEPVEDVVAAWADEALAGADPAQKKVLVWIRQTRHDAHRNSGPAEVAALCGRALEAGLQPVLVGDAVEAEVPPGALDRTLFWRLPLFQGITMRRRQLQLFDHWMRRHALVGQVGVTTAGMDGPALIGLPTLYLTDEPNPRLGLWVGAVPGYEEVVRRGGELERVRRRFGEWAR